MRHFLFVGDKREVLGVWVADDALAGRRLRLELELKYPDCETYVDEARDYESFKAGFADYEFGEIEPAPIE